MKKTLIVLLLLMQSICYAQNYECLQANVKHYFLNGVNYLRGIRVDSVVTSGSDIVYYPYRTLRYNNVSGQEDTSGSWLGKRVVQKPDGMCQFDNLHGDTTFINTQAGLGQSWIFYNDTGINYYTATVYAVDTMSFLGITDSIKKIIVTSSSNNDIVDSMYIYLSKNNGLVRTFDLFNFPFPNYWNPEFFLQASENGGGIPFPENQDFHIIPLHLPTQKEIYNYHSGDVLCYGFYLYGDCECGGGGTRTGWDYDSILTRTDIDAYHTQLVYYHKNFTHYMDCTIPPTQLDFPSYITIDTLNIDTALVMQMPYMPEEYLFDSLITYNTADTAYGITSFAIKAYGSWPGSFESPLNTTDYKSGLGIIDSDVQYSSICQNAQNPIGDEHRASLGFGVKDGQGFGQRVDLGVSDALQNIQSGLTVYPNPANIRVTVTARDNNKKHITVTDAYGRMLQSTNFNKQISIETGTIPPGIYYVSVTDETGKKTVSKISIVH